MTDLRRRKYGPRFDYAYTQREVRTMVLRIQKALYPIFDELERPRDRILFYVALAFLCDEMYKSSAIDSERKFAV